MVTVTWNVISAFRAPNNAHTQSVIGNLQALPPLPPKKGGDLKTNVNKNPKRSVIAMLFFLFNNRTVTALDYSRRSIVMAHVPKLMYKCACKCGGVGIEELEVLESKNGAHHTICNAQDYA